MPISDDGTQGFLSYAREDFPQPNIITRFKEQLQWSIGASLGSNFAIYHDRKNLPIGEEHKQPLREAIEGSFFFFPMVSRRYFRNPNTQWELDLALSARHRKGTGNYYIVPIYTLQAPDEIYDDPDLKDNGLINPMKLISMVDEDDWRQLYRHLNYRAAEKRMRSLGTRLADQIRTRPPPRSVTDDSSAGEASISERRHVVAKEGGDFSSIQEAIDSASPGDHIDVRGGEYRENLILDKPLELVGAGIGETYVRAAKEDVLRITTAIAHITGFSFVQEGKTGFGVSISRGRPELHDCEITSSGYACLSVHSGADPRVHDSSIHHGAQAGILIHSGGLGTFEDNKIHRCEHANVEVADGSSPIFRRNDIYEGRKGGVYIRDSAKGRFESNNIHHNSWSNVSIALNGSPSFKDNWIRSGYDVGVDIQDGGSGEFDGNMICWNRKNGVKVSKQGSPTLRRNKIHDNTESGVYVTDHGRGRLEENHISGNGHAGLAIHGFSAPEARWNTITRNRAQGIHIIDAGELAIENNLLIHNSDAGITMEPITSGVSGNRAEENGTYGLEYTADDGQDTMVDTFEAGNWLDGNFFAPMHRKEVGVAETETENALDDDHDERRPAEPPAAGT